MLAVHGVSLGQKEARGSPDIQGGPVLRESNVMELLVTQQWAAVAISTARLSKTSETTPFFGAKVRTENACDLRG